LQRSTRASVRAVRSAQRSHRENPGINRRRGQRGARPCARNLCSRAQKRCDRTGQAIFTDRFGKPIKTLHLGVYTPNVRVHVAAPMAVTDDAVRLAIIGPLGWIKRQRAKFTEQRRESRRWAPRAFQARCAGWKDLYWQRTRDAKCRYR
jgi:hypothetical protein